ncbi:hypothetical protein [Erwinia amylovora]
MCIRDRLSMALNSLTPVSYTHLDVYKRQAQYGIKQPNPCLLYTSRCV